MNTARGVLVGALFLTSQAASAATITLAGSGDTSVVGAQVTVTAHVAGLPAPGAESLGAYDVDLLYDSTVLEFLSAVFVDSGSGGNQLDFPEPGSLGFLGDALDTGFALDVFGVSGNSPGVLDTMQAAAFDLFTLTFRVQSPQTTTVALNLADPNLQFGDSTGTPLGVTAGPATVTFASTGTIVPEPGTASLLLLGAAAALRRHLRSVTRN